MAARRIGRLDQLKDELSKKYPTIKIYTHNLDVCEKSNVDQLISSLPEDFKDIDVLVNNAGVYTNKFINLLILSSK